MISYNNEAPKAVNNVGQFGATEGTIGAYKSAAEYAADAKYWALLSQTKYSSLEEILAEVERLYAQGLLLEEDIKQLKSDFELQEQVLLGLIQSTGTAIDNTNAATELSKEATQNVLAQLDIISNMTVQTTLLPPGSLATGSYDNETGKFSFGIPEGAPGRDGTDGTISDIGSVNVGVPDPEDYGFYVDSIDGGLYRTSMTNIANLVPSIKSISINGGPEQTGEVSFNSVSSFKSRTGDVIPQSGDYSVEQVIGAAKSGDNSDITSLNGLTTPLSPQQGGTGASSIEGARSNLGVDRINNDSTQTTVGSADGRTLLNITNNPEDWGVIWWNGSSYETKPLGVGKGGTGATNAAGARSNLGLGPISTLSIVPISNGGTGATSSENARLALVAAKSGDNSDITSFLNKVSFAQPVSVPDASSSDEAPNIGQISELLSQSVIDDYRRSGDLRGWGCVCDGVTDDSDNFQAAVDYADAHDTPIFIPGPIRITKKIVFAKPPQIRGFMYSPPVIGKFHGVPYAEKGCIIYSEVPTGPCIEINPASNNNYIRGLNLIDFHVLARGVGVNGSGVKINNCGWGGYSRGVVIEGFKNGGLELSQVQDSKFDQLEILNCGTDGVVAALQLKSYSNLISFDRLRLEANEFQMDILESIMLDFSDSHLEQGDYPDSGSGEEFQKINTKPSIRIRSSHNINFHGGVIFGATLKEQISKKGLTPSTAPYHVQIGGDCSGIHFNGVTMGFGYASGKLIEHHGDGIFTSCKLLALDTRFPSIYLDGNISFRNNSLVFEDTQDSDTMQLMTVAYCTVEGNIFASVNPSSVNKIYGSMFVSIRDKPARFGSNQFIFNKRPRFIDGSCYVITRDKDGIEASSGGAIDKQQFIPTSYISLYGGVGGASNVTSIDNSRPNEETIFINNGTGPISFIHGGNIINKSSTDYVLQPGAMCSYVYNPMSGANLQIW